MYVCDCIFSVVFSFSVCHSFVFLLKYDINTIEMDIDTIETNFKLLEDASFTQTYKCTYVCTYVHADIYCMYLRMCCLYIIMHVRYITTYIRM